MKRFIKVSVLFCIFVWFVHSAQDADQKNSKFVLSDQNILSWEELDQGISFKLNPAYIRELEELTRANLNKTMNFYVGDLLVSTPVIPEVINTGHVFIVAEADKKIRIIALLPPTKNTDANDAPLKSWREAQDAKHNQKQENIPLPSSYVPHVLNCLKPMGHHIWTQEYECPIGHEKFTSLSLGSHSRFGVYLDWKPVSYIIFPVPIAVCPSNGMVLIKPVYTEEELAKIEKIVSTDEYQKVFSEQNASYYLYAKINEIIKDKDAEQWWLLLNATWEANGCNDREKYKDYALETIESAKTALQSLSETDNKYWMISIIIPNLHRRIGDFENAQNWLEKIKDIPQEHEQIQLAYDLLSQAIKDKNTQPVQVRKPKEQ